MNLYYLILSFFSRDAHIKRLQNKVLHVAVEYQKSKTKIADALKVFQDTRAHIVSDFEELKRSTTDDTLDAVSLAKEHVEAEKAVIEHNYNSAIDKVKVKEASISQLHDMIQNLGNQDHPLE